MKTIIALGLYTIASSVLGLVACGLLLWFKKKKTAAAMAAIFFGGPVAAHIYLFIQDAIEEKRLKEDVAYVQELCSKYGGDKIYKTVDNVEGVFQMKARNIAYDDQLRDQFGMENPYGHSQGDPIEIQEFLNDQRISSKAGYIYVETQPDHDQVGPPYRRFYLTPTGKKIGDKYPGANKPGNPMLKVTEKQVPKLASHYGYAIEDLSTPELRKRWIGGGRIKILDLRSNEVLAERIGYFRAPGMTVQLHWAARNSCGNNYKSKNNLKEFLYEVLKPVANQPIPHYSDF